MTGRLGRLLDAALDRAVVPGYSAVGYRLRRRGWDEDDPAPGSLVGRVALVTGAGSGLGLATATGLARLGARVHLVVRDRAKGRRAVAAIHAEVPAADLVLDHCDLSDLSSVRSFTDALRGTGISSGGRPVDRVDVLVHNAGVMPPQRTESPDGHELSLATHVLGPVLMTERLRPLLAAAHGARVVLVSSGGMYTQRLPVSDPEFEQGGYDGTRAYARTKRMQVSLTPLMQERWAADGVAVHVMHPGWADTPGIATSMPRFHRLVGPVLRSPEQGADTVVWLAATTPAPGGGQLWHDRAPRPEHYLPTTRAADRDVRLLWAQVLADVGLSDDPGGRARA